MERDDIVEPDFDDDVRPRIYPFSVVIDTLISGVQFGILYRFRGGIRAGTHEKDRIGETRTEKV